MRLADDGCLDADAATAAAEGTALDDERARILAHLDGCSECRLVVSELARQGERVSPGTKVGRHVLIAPVGSGGMGVVWAADDPRLGRRVAIKLVRLDRSDRPEPRERLLSEARAMARLSHPNILPVYDAGVDDGRAYVVMELITGTTLRDWQRDPRPWREVLARYLAAGRGLAAAHAAGIVHRDFKPANVLCASDGRVLVTDFGLARLDCEGDAPGGATSGGAPASRSGRGTRGASGTPAYMALEQHEGHAADARSDQFAFAVALHEALYGQHPFGDDTALLERLRSGRPRAGRASAGTPRGLARLLTRAMAPDPAARHPSMPALLAAIEAVSRSGRSPWRWAIASGLAAAAAGALAYGGLHERVVPTHAATRTTDLARAFAPSVLPAPASAPASRATPGEQPEPARRRVHPSPPSPPPVAAAAAPATAPSAAALACAPLSASCDPTTPCCDGQWCDRGAGRCVPRGYTCPGRPWAFCTDEPLPQPKRGAYRRRADGKPGAVRWDDPRAAP